MPRPFHRARGRMPSESRATSDQAQAVDALDVLAPRGDEVVVGGAGEAAEGLLAVEQPATLGPACGGVDQHVGVAGLHGLAREVGQEELVATHREEHLLGERPDHLHLVVLVQPRLDGSERQQAPRGRRAVEEEGERGRSAGGAERVRRRGEVAQAAAQAAVLHGDDESQQARLRRAVLTCPGGNSPHASASVGRVTQGPGSTDSTRSARSRSASVRSGRRYSAVSRAVILRLLRCRRAAWGSACCPEAPGRDRVPAGAGRVGRRVVDAAGGRVRVSDGASTGVSTSTAPSRRTRSSVATAPSTAPSVVSKWWTPLLSAVSALTRPSRSRSCRPTRSGTGRASPTASWRRARTSSGVAVPSVSWRQISRTPRRGEGLRRPRAPSPAAPGGRRPGGSAAPRAGSAPSVATAPLHRAGVRGVARTPRRCGRPGPAPRSPRGRSRPAPSCCGRRRGDASADRHRARRLRSGPGPGPGPRTRGPASPSSRPTGRPRPVRQGWTPGRRRTAWRRRGGRRRTGPSPGSGRAAAPYGGRCAPRPPRPRRWCGRRRGARARPGSRASRARSRAAGSRSRPSDQVSPSEPVGDAGDHAGEPPGHVGLVLGQHADAEDAALARSARGCRASGPGRWRPAAGSGSRWRTSSRSCRASEPSTDVVTTVTPLGHWASTSRNIAGRPRHLLQIREYTISTSRWGGVGQKILTGSWEHRTCEDL